MNLNDKSILVTGGTESLGKKFKEITLHEFHPKKLIILSRDELKQDEMRQAYRDTGESPMRYFVDDVRDQERLHWAFSGVDIVVRAAALKQVPASEHNPFEGVQTNVMGAKNVIDAALECGVSKVMAISTDKAVNPINLCGATNLCAQKMFVRANAYPASSGTKFSVCRYGNAVGCRGTAVPLFRKRRQNGTITIMDPRMSRFWISLAQGVQFLIQCIEQMQGGEIFVPKIPGMNIVDLPRLRLQTARLNRSACAGGKVTRSVSV